jgi:hypothetical protein
MFVPPAVISNPPALATTVPDIAGLPMSIAAKSPALLVCAQTALSASATPSVKE